VSGGNALLLVGALVDLAGLGFLAAYRWAPWVDLPIATADLVRRRRRRVPWVLAAGTIIVIAGALWH
jgi:hypothetical protein